LQDSFSGLVVWVCRECGYCVNGEKVPKFPKGQITPLSLLIASLILFELSTRVIGVVVYFYLSPAYLCLCLSLYVYLGGKLPCRERVPDKFPIMVKHLLCPRCTGFWLGIIFSTVLVVLFRMYGLPSLSPFVGWILFIIGFCLWFPTAIHGIFRRYYDKDFTSKAVANVFLYLTGFLTALGGFFIFLAFTSW